MSWIPSYKKPGGGGGDLPEIVTWSDGTDEQIVAMLDAHYNGVIDIHDYWSVGDERVISLSAMSGSYSFGHIAQDIIMVLMNDGGKELVTPINGISECAFIVGQKNLLANKNGIVEYEYMNTTNTNSGGWKNANRRTWCNSTYKNAFPSTIIDIFKEYKNITGNGGNPGSTAVTVNDYFALPAVMEVYGEVTYASTTVEAQLSQFKYYETTANRIKYQGNSSSSEYAYWFRSPIANNTTGFCCYYTKYNESTGAAYDMYLGVAPFGVI